MRIPWKSEKKHIFSSNFKSINHIFCLGVVFAIFSLTRFLLSDSNSISPCPITLNEEAEELYVIGDLTPYSECILTFELTDLAGGKSDPDATLTITLSDDDVPVCDPKTVKISITETQGEHQVGNILVEKLMSHTCIGVNTGICYC